MSVCFCVCGGGGGAGSGAPGWTTLVFRIGPTDWTRAPARGVAYLLRENARAVYDDDDDDAAAALGAALGI